MSTETATEETILDRTAEMLSQSPAVWCFYQGIPDPLEGVNKLGLAIARSGVFGPMCDDLGRVIAIHCMVERISPFVFMRDYHVVQNKLVMKADAMLARFRRAGGTHEILERSGAAAVLLLIHGKQQYKSSYTWEEARIEAYPYTGARKTLKSTWATPRGRMQMLWSRAISDGVRALCPEVIAGIYTPEDMGEIVEPSNTASEITAVTEEAMALARTSRPEATEPEPTLVALPDPTTTADKYTMNTAAVDVAEISDPSITIEQLEEMMTMKESLEYDDKTWSEILGRIGVGTVHDMSTAEGERVNVFLRRQKAETA